MSIESVLKQANKKYGSNVITKGVTVDEIPRIPTGSLSLDVETGGGIPVGKITTITGQFSDGKSSIVLKIVAEFQKLYSHKEVVWIDAEGFLDRQWAETLGVNIDDVYVVHPEYSQQAFDIAEQMISADAGLVVIDSVAALLPKEEAEASMEDWQVGLAARVNNKFMRKAQSSLIDKRSNDVPPTVILINQLRESMSSGPYGPADTEPGGKGLKFHSALKIKLRKGELYPKPKSNYDIKVTPKAQQIKFYVEKNRTAPPFTRGHVYFFFDTLDKYRIKGTYDRLEELIRYATKFRLVVQRGAMYDLTLPDTGEVKAFKGSVALATFLRENEEVMRDLEKKIVKLVTEYNAGSQPQVVADEGDDEAEGDESSETDNEETTELRSDSVGEGGSEVRSIPDPTQTDSIRENPVSSGIVEGPGKTEAPRYRREENASVRAGTN